jgi:organic hydroperoxide reductase OsmC/OhrA
MSIVKSFRFPVRSAVLGPRRVELNATGKPELEVATPPEFKGGLAGIWSPEELLVGAVVSCYELTLTAIAERLEVPLAGVSVDAAGHVERGARGYAFIVVELDVELETEPGFESRARRAARLAEEHCIVGRALEVPVHVRLSIRAADLARVAS